MWGVTLLAGVCMTLAKHVIALIIRSEVKVLLLNC